MGCQKEDLDLLSELLLIGCFRIDFITIDIAHGHSKNMKIALDAIRPMFKGKIVAGNVATPEGVGDLVEWGADVVKVGVGGGAPCTTKNKTGFHVPMATCAQKCASVDIAPLIIDGGIRENGDIAKALVAGCMIDKPIMIMIGSLFASCLDSPANGDKVKLYFGSASETCKGDRLHIEGKVIQIETNGMTYAEKLEEIRQDLASAISYAGGKDLNAFKNVNWTEI